MLEDTSNMTEIMNRFMETSNITIKPKETRIHRLVILRLIYSFGASVDVTMCTDKLFESGIRIGDFNRKNTEVMLFRILTCCAYIVQCIIIFLFLE